jgi:CTP synthase (UTP-ammonia lyase)
MKNTLSVALIGDYNPTVIAHNAIPAALDRAAAEGGVRVGCTWVHTSGLGDVRAVELEGHPFFVATLYQPQRAILAGRSHPLIAAYVAAASAWI